MSSFDVCCPNPHCGLTFSSPRGLSLHLSSSRGQSCNYVAQQLHSFASASTRSPVSLSVCQFEHNAHANYKSFGSLMPSRSLLMSEEPICAVNTEDVTMENVDEMTVPPEINDDATDINDDATDIGVQPPVAVVDGEPVVTGAEGVPEPEEFFTFSKHQELSAKLLTMLDNWNVPNDGFRDIVNWYEEARHHNISFRDRNKTREAVINEIHNALPNDTGKTLMPYLLPVQLAGFRETVDLVCFDIVAMIKSLLTNENVMQNDHLHINQEDPFDNYRCGLDSGQPISEPRLGSVYQNYLRNRPNDPNEFVFDLIVYIDRTHIDMNSRFTCCPVVFTSSLFNEKARRNHMFWRQLGYMFDVTLRSSAENATSSRGHATLNNHAQLSVLLDGLRKVQNGEDTRLNNVWLTINGVRRCVNIVVPILYFMNDAKEGDMLCCRVSGHHGSTRCHSRTCDMLFENMLDVFHPCSMKTSGGIDALVDANNVDALHALSQYNIRSCFRLLEFCDPLHGIFGAQPGDLLHMYQLGLIKTGVVIFFYCFTNAQKTMLDDMGRRFHHRLKQSHRANFPGTDFSRGITNTKQKQAEEYTGLLYVLCALINNHDAWVLVDTALTKHGLDIVQVLELFECLLCFDTWCKKAEYWTMADWAAEQQTALNAIRYMLSLLFVALPRTKGNGWALSKMHDILHVPNDITRFGSPWNYNTGFCEHNHKYQAKIPGRKAAKRHATFTKSVAKNIVDAHALNLFTQLIDQRNAIVDKQMYGTDPVPAVNAEANEDNTESVKWATQCKIQVKNNLISAQWNTRANPSPTLCDGILYFIVNHFGMTNENAKKVTFYTQYERNQVKFRCHPLYRGVPWYDWVMLLYSDDNHPNEELQCPARLMGIVVEDDTVPIVYHPIVQWAGNRTNVDSVLFDEYDFEHAIDPKGPESFSVHDVESIERPIFVIDCETENHKKILVAKDVDEWANMFLS